MWLWVALALAAPPDGSPAEFALGSGAADRVTVSADGRLTAAVADSGLHLLDMDDWSVQSTSPCTVNAAALEWWATDVHYLWFGCTDGGVRVQLWEDGALSTVEEEGEPVVFDLGEDPVLGVWWWSAGELMYALTEDGDGLLQLHTIDTVTGDVDQETGFPAALVRTGFVEGVTTTSYLVLFHGGDDVSQLSFGSSTPIINTPLSPYSPSEFAPSIRDTVYGGARNAVAEYLPSTRTFQAFLTGVGTVEAIGASTLTDDEWLIVVDETGATTWELSSGTVVGTEPLYSFDPGDSLVDIAVARWGYAFAATSDGGLRVITANPWVSDLTATPTTATDGDTVTVSFTVDTPGSYELKRGGDASGDGATIASGDVAVAGAAEAEVTVDSSWSEGANPLYLLHSADGLIGHDVTEVTVDSPPGAVRLDQDSLTFGNQSLRVSFTGLSDADMDHYDIYITTTAFESADWPTGGPAFDGDDPIDAPFEVEAAGGEDVSFLVSPLTNDVVYYIAVRATDTGGKEGPMSDVVQGTPKPTYSASELAGDPGGYGCATGSPAGWLALALGALALGARRRWGVLAGSAVLLLVALVPEQGRADPARDATQAWGNFEFRYGTLQFVEEVGGDADEPNAVVDVYGRSGDVGYLEIGPQLGRVVEVDFGVGLFQKVASATSASGEESGEIAMMTLWPFYADASLRLHLLDEQFLVPFFRFGLDYVLWSEERESSAGSRVTTRGGKAGSHFGLGAGLLLDTFAQGRASLLEATTGINDTYLLFEWRRQRVEPGKFLFWDNSEGLSFSGDLFQVGLKLDF
jgi:hypothetical protein